MSRKSAGTLTFKPLGGGKFRCNQRPELGKLTKGQVESLRRRENVAYRKQIEQDKTNRILKLADGPERAADQILVVTHSQMRTECPECSWRINLFNVRSRSTVTCSWCYRNYRLIRSSQ